MTVVLNIRRREGKPPLIVPAHFIALCGECGNAPGSARARICSRTDCGLVDRHAKALIAAE